jgi:uncharacterized protein YecE (DUF72 family)
VQQSFDFAEPNQPAQAPRVEPISLGAGRVLVGTCGYSYKDWIGPFYPERTKPGEMLPFYARRFSAVEIDSTYYRIPSSATFASMAKRTPPDFRFSVKVPGSLTHVVAQAQGVTDDARLFRENLAPLVQSGKLAAALMQFPQSFRPSTSSEAYLRELREALPGISLVAEFRSREWQRAQTLDLLAELQIAWCNVDEPQFAGLLRPSSDVVGPLGYVRLHGRNYKKWFRGDAAERYEYSYSVEELAPWTARVADIAAQACQTYVFFNNHRFGQAAGNAQTFARMLLAQISV